MKTKNTFTKLIRDIQTAHRELTAHAGKAINISLTLPNSVFSPYATVATNLCFFKKGVPTTDIWY